MKTLHRIGLATLLMVPLWGLLACSHTVSRQVDDTGQAAEIMFPDTAANTWTREGTYPSLERLRSVREGMDKTQLMDAFGPPHFAEGLWDVREWDYLFHVPDGHGGARRCQFKVLFDKGMVARGFYSLPDHCAG